MRSIPADLSTKLSNPIQTRANNSDPSASIWVGRPTTVLTNSTFLEKQTVVQAPITDSSIAVCHPRLNTENTKIYIGYVSNGIAKVGVALTKVKMSSHVWLDTNFSETADHISVAFDGTMPKNVNGKYEFLTESEPWVFWTSAGALYARKLGTADTITLASANATWVDAIRATWSEIAAFDFGLCCFFIVNGAVYYRQLIGGVWYDAEAIPAAALPTVDSGVTWTQVSCSRTWDWRIALQLKASDGKMYECFTQFMGIGSKNAEHLEIKNVTATGEMSEVHYSDTSEDEHINISSIAATGSLIYGLSSKPVSAGNVDDGNGNYGLIVKVTMDYPVTGVTDNAAAFALTDSSGGSYACTAATVEGKIVTLTCIDFNAAYGKTLNVAYTPGTVQSPAVAMEAWTITFTPTGLVPTTVPAPTVTEVTNI